MSYVSSNVTVDVSQAMIDLAHRIQFALSADVPDTMFEPAEKYIAMQ